MAKQGVRISKELETAIKSEYLHQWNLGLRGRRISATVILDGLERSGWDPDHLPEIQTVMRYTKDIRDKLNNID